MMLNNSSQSAILLDGVPGNWIQCKNGLRQGDSISPYLFIIVANILQRMILYASNQGLLQHPIITNAPCPMLQYADDTLIIIKADPDHLAHLKLILHNFSLATGLTINFEKSTFAPIHVDPHSATLMASSLGCTVASFPQNYLGLPLSTHKLRLLDFHPMIAKVDKRLAGWRGHLLSAAGRAVLVKSVIRALPTYAMSAMLLPAGTILEIDKRCRAFFWAGDDTVNGGQCKVAWDEVCAPICKGGLGFRCLRTHNICLLLKSLSKIHCPGNATWETWLANTYGWAGGHYIGDTHRLHTNVWKDLTSGLPFFRSITHVNIGNSISTAFWLDLWIGAVPLAFHFPNLFSHTTKQNVSVAFVLADVDLRLSLQPRLSNAANSELQSLRSLLATVILMPQVPDSRLCRINDKPLTVAFAYEAAFDSRPEDLFADFIWGRTMRLIDAGCFSGSHTKGVCSPTSVNSEEACQTLTPARSARKLNQLPHAATLPNGL
ncbi:uncharacterized protein [Triticum aestivum]|uniref:uncharacterized protein n=1 Tax=Triticum aestivum TaxID=4565 RepID=UPI001D033786|nr:uncharacterized protein LOC123183403 [Triticum aestivum]XP_044452147.1 uncharacterized protein LOC123183403 [Triticum aestivum]